MTFRRAGALVLTVLAGVFSSVVTLHGVDTAFDIDFRFSPALTTLYCALPFLSFPTFLLTRKFRKLALLQAVLAIAYLAVYSALNWRTCSSLGDCTSVAATVILTLQTHAVLAFIAVNLCEAAAQLLQIF